MARPKTLRNIPESAWFDVLDEHEGRILRLLDEGVARLFSGVKRAADTATAWEEFVSLLASRLSVGGKVQDIIAEAAKDALAMTGLTVDDGVGALAAFAIPDELVREGLEQYTRQQASNYLARRSGSLVREIDGKTLRSLRGILAGHDLMDADPPRRLLDAIGELVGLTKYQGEVFLNDLAKRQAAGTVRTEGDVVKLWRKHVRRRARVIVETEAGQATNAGIQNGYRALSERLDIPIRGMDDVFISDTGERSAGPLLHVRCRCTTRLFGPFAGAYWVEWVTRIFGACPRCIAFDAKLKGFDTAVLPGEAAA